MFTTINAQHLRNLGYETSCLGDLMRYIRDTFPALFNMSVHLSNGGVERMIGAAMLLSGFNGNSSLATTPASDATLRRRIIENGRFIERVNADWVPKFTAHLATLTSLVGAQRYEFAALERTSFAGLRFTNEIAASTLESEYVVDNRHPLFGTW